MSAHHADLPAHYRRVQAASPTDSRKGVKVADLRIPLALTHEGLMLTCTDWGYPVKAEQLETFHAKEGYDNR